MKSFVSSRPCVLMFHNMVIFQIALDFND
uniref:Uncharacterized protein n=1 Tax=Rhizophora mucronata TaxID=61149 RepID=A0A2P2NB82_RHIMU